MLMRTYVPRVIGSNEHRFKYDHTSAHMETKTAPKLTKRDRKV